MGYALFSFLQTLNSKLRTPNSELIRLLIQEENAVIVQIIVQTFKFLTVVVYRNAIVVPFATFLFRK